jgi:hypothetical protein
MSKKSPPLPTSTRSNKNKGQVEKKPTTKNLCTHARKKQVQPSPRSTELTEFEMIILQKSYLNQLTPQDLTLSDCHIFENATERCEGILDSFVEESETVLEEGNEKKVVDSSVEEAHMGLVARVVSSVTESSKNETSCNDEGRTSTSTSISITSNSNLDGYDRTTNTTTKKNGAVKTEKFRTSSNSSNQPFVDLSTESGSSASITNEQPSDASVSVGSPSESSLSLSTSIPSDSESVSKKSTNRSNSSSSSDTSGTSSSSSDSEDDSSSVPSMDDSDIDNMDV